MGGRGPQPQLPVSPYAPQIDNIRHGAWVSSGATGESESAAEIGELGLVWAAMQAWRRSCLPKVL